MAYYGKIDLIILGIKQLMEESIPDINPDQNNVGPESESQDTI